MDGVQLPQGQSRFEKAVYFLPLSFQKFLVLILLALEGLKAEWTLETPSGFEHGTHVCNYIVLNRNSSTQLLMKID